MSQDMLNLANSRFELNELLFGVFVLAVVGDVAVRAQFLNSSSERWKLVIAQCISFPL
jgi:hypothetical protein